MNLQKEYKRIDTYIAGNITQLPAAYVLDDYNQLVQAWEGLSITPAMNEQLQAARQKTISADILIKLNEIILAYNKNETLPHIDDGYKKSIINTIEQAKQHIKESSKLKYLLHVEHDVTASSTYVELQDSTGSVIVIESDIVFSLIRDILESPSWQDLNDFFRGVFLGEVEFIEEFKNAFKLQSYLQFHKILDDLGLFKPLNNVLPKGMKIIVGEHDGYEFEFVVK